MAKFSKLNLQNIVINIAQFDSEDQAESFGGIWSPYQLGDTTGDIFKIYDPTWNIFKDVAPIDMVGAACSSWSLNTSTGRYSSPVTKPGITTSQDNAGQFYGWYESKYQADNNAGWALTSR